MGDITIELATYGTSFATRDAARLIGQRIRESCRDAGNIAIDFKGVHVVSYSFADQLFAEVAQQLHDWGHVHGMSFIGCNEETIDVLDTVLTRRSKIEPSSPQAAVYSDHIALAPAR